MEKRQSDIDNGDDNVVNINSDGLNYSFDFSSQVMPNQNPAPQPVNNAQRVEPAQAVETPNVAPAPQPVNNAQRVEPAQAVETPNVAPQVSQTTEQTNNNQNVNSQVAQNEETGENLIKDKKGTKKFLIIIAVIVIAFIIALPFIYNLLG